MNFEKFEGADTRLGIQMRRRLERLWVLAGLSGSPAQGGAIFGD